VAVVGAHLSGMPLNTQLTERGAVLVGEAKTQPTTASLPCPAPHHPSPACCAWHDGRAAPIALEVWEMPAAHYGSFVALIPAPLGIGTLMLADGSSVQGFVCEPEALRGAEDITQLGGWRAYMASLAQQSRHYNA
jgi:allophanate hydrolase